MAETETGQDTVPNEEVATGPMRGVKVVELGVWLAGPAASGILADWGADVVKIEPPSGDPCRMFQWMLGGDMPTNPVFEMDNRSKKGIAVDLGTDDGLAIAMELLADAKVEPIKRRKGSKNVPFGIAFVKTTFNNTIVSFTDMRGNVISWSSAGRCNFKGSRKSTAFAATTVAQEAARANDVFVQVSLYEQADRDDGLGYNTAVLVGPTGKIVARTRKLHIPVTEGYFEDCYFAQGPNETPYPVHSVVTDNADVQLGILRKSVKQRSTRKRDTKQIRNK